MSADLFIETSEPSHTCECERHEPPTRQKVVSYEMYRNHINAARRKANVMAVIAGLAVSWAIIMAVALWSRSGGFAQ